MLVTDGDTRAALAVTRSLGRSGCAVHVSAPRACSLAGMSRYCAEQHLQATAGAGVADSLRVLLRVVREAEAQVVVGATDRTLALLHGSRDDLAPAVLPPPARADYERASDKVQLFGACRRIGIAVPPGLVVEGGSEPDPADLTPLGSPVVVRPARSWRIDADRWIRGTVTYEDGIEGIRRRLREDEALRFPYLVQKKIDGSGCGLFLLARDGRILRKFAHARLREKPPTGGVSTLCVSVEPPSDLVAVAEKWADFMTWSGLAMLEFKRGDDGCAYLLEVNARPWGSMALSAAAGIDFPFDLISLAGARTATGGGEYRAGVRLRWWWGDVDHFYLKERANGRSKPATVLHALSRALTAGPWPEAWDTFRRDDPLPFLFETARWGRA